jgi:hypothetical protein
MRRGRLRRIDSVWGEMQRRVFDQRNLHLLQLDGPSCCQAGRGSCYFSIYSRSLSSHCTLSLLRLQHILRHHSRRHAARSIDFAAIMMVDFFKSFFTKIQSQDRISCVIGSFLRVLKKTASQKRKVRDCQGATEHTC